VTVSPEKLTIWTLAADVEDAANLLLATSTDKILYPCPESDFANAGGYLGGARPGFVFERIAVSYTRGSTGLAQRAWNAYNKAGILSQHRGGGVGTTWPAGITLAGFLEGTEYMFASRGFSGGEAWNNGAYVRSAVFFSKVKALVGWWGWSTPGPAAVIRWPVIDPRDIFSGDHQFCEWTDAAHRNASTIEAVNFPTVFGLEHLMSPSARQNRQPHKLLASV